MTSKSKPYRVVLIAAMDQNGLIGVNGDMPWHCPVDLKHFRYLTMGKVILMGRRTAESLRKPLRDRVNIVLTRDAKWSKDGFIRVSNDRDIRRILKRAEQQELWVIGGGAVYRKYIKQADVVHITALQTTVDIKPDDQPVYFPVDALRRYRGVHAQSSTDPNVVFWVFTPNPVCTGRNKPISAVIV